MPQILTSLSCKMSPQSPLLQSRGEESSDESHGYGTVSSSSEPGGPKTFKARRSGRVCRGGLYRAMVIGKHICLSTVHVVYNQWFVFALIFLIVIASQRQVPEKDQELKKLLVIYICVSIIFFVTGCTLPSQTLLQNYSRWKLHLFCQIQSFILISAMVFGVVSACASSHSFMDPGLLVGLLLMGCVPTTISSNVVLTQQAGGNQALTVVQSTLGNFLGPFICPLLIAMYTSTNAWYTDIVPDRATGKLDELYRRVLKQLGLSIYLPLVSILTRPVISLTRYQFLGQIVRNLFPRITATIFKDFRVSKVSQFALLLIMWQPFDHAFAVGAFSDVKANNIVFLVFISIVLYALWTFMSLALSLFWLNQEDTVAVAYTLPAKTTSIGVPLAEAIFIGVSPIVSSKIQIPLVIFQGLQVACGSLLVNAFRHWLAHNKQDLDDTRVAKNAGTERG